MLKDVPVKLKVPDGEKVEFLILIQEGNTDPQQVKFKKEGNVLFFRVPQLKLYDLVVIQLG